jgi:hypothetical protein
VISPGTTIAQFPSVPNPEGIMGDQRNHGRQNTHDTGSPAARPRDDLRTANKKRKPNEKRDEDRDREDDKEKGKTDAGNEKEGA